MRQKKDMWRTVVPGNYGNGSPRIIEEPHSESGTGEIVR